MIAFIIRGPSRFGVPSGQPEWAVFAPFIAIALAFLVIFVVMKFGRK